MKSNLGKGFLSLIFMMLGFVMLKAEDFNYKFNIDKLDPYVKEPVALILDINQTNHDTVMFFKFDIKKSKAYTFQRLDTQETDTYHNTKVRYTYLLYPLQAGDINITFELIQKTTTDESIAYGFSGDRDNIKNMVTTDSRIDLPSLDLKVKPVPEGTLLVGDFSLTHKIKKLKAKAYEPLPMQVSIKGIGYPPLLDTLLPEEGNFTRFTEEPIIQSFPSTKGTHSTVIYPMALSHKQSFTLAPIVLKAFNPKTEKAYTLEVPAQAFEIQEVDKETLVDKIDAPEVLKTDWSWLRTLFGYIIVFAAGYLTATSWKWKKRQGQKEDDPIIHKIEACKNEKALFQVLMASDNKRFAPIIEKLENSLYGNGKINFNKLKQDSLDKVRKEEQI